VTNEEYKALNYERIYYRVHKGGKAILQEEATKRNKTVNALITEALEAQYGLDLSKKTK
jgi:hypothetical protein